MKHLGASLVDHLLEVERKLQGPEQFQAKQEIILHFEQHEPDLFAHFRSNVVSPYQLLVKVQKAFETQSDVTFGDLLLSKNDAVMTLKRYIPNLQYLHDNQLYTHSDSFKELGAAVAIGVVGTGITESVGRAFVSNPYLSMEMAIAETLGIAVLVFLWFLGSRNRSVFHKAPWNSAIYLGANLHENDPNNWEYVTWKYMQQSMHPSRGFTLLKNRPHYESLDTFYTKPYERKQALPQRAD